MQDYDKDFNVFIPRFEEEYICICLPNKSGDNNVLLTKDDCKDVMNQKVSMKWISQRIKKKWETKISPTSTA